MKQLLNVIVSIWFILLSGCTNDPNEKANELFVTASGYAQNMRSETESYSNALESYNNAQEHIERILSKYSASNLAVRLLSEEIQVSGFTLTEFRKLGNFLQLLAEAEQEPLSCALLVAKAIEDESSKALALVEIVSKYAEVGQFSQAHETAKTIEDESSKARALAEIASKYAEAGQNEKANQLLSKAYRSE